MSAPTPLEQLLAVSVSKRTVSIGLPASTDPSERRFPLTPEGAGLLAEMGYKVIMESEAAREIHYADSAYVRQGVTVADRAQALRADVVLHLPPISVADARRMRRGAMLLTLLHPLRQNVAAVKLLLDNGITAVALDHITDAAGHRPFADILHEIDGRASIALASALLADAVEGKGILLGGIPGIVPCEVTVIGADIAGCAAARAAVGAGATVRIFDNDIYRLRTAMADLGPGIIASAMHPRVLENALRTADIVIADEAVEITPDLVDVMKRGVIIFDLAADGRSSFPSLYQVDLAAASARDTLPESGGRLCYINGGSAVPRTAAMALSNTLRPMLETLLRCDGTSNFLKLNPGVASGVYTYRGRLVNARLARRLKLRMIDIAILLSC